MWITRQRLAAIGLAIVLALGLVVAVALGNRVERKDDQPSATEAPITTSRMGLIAFSSDRAGEYDVFTMGDDGSNIARVTNSPGPDVQPAWSPDGNLIALEYRPPNT
jgi:TolB protein